MDDKKELSGFAGNELLFASIKRWSADQQTMFLRLIQLLNSAGIDMWYSKKKNFIRCGLRFVGRSHGRGYLRFGGIACNLDGFLFSMQLSDTGLPQKKRIAVDENVLKKIEAAFELWNIRLAENSVGRAPNTLGSWPIDYSEEDATDNDSDLEESDLIVQPELQKSPLNQIFFGPPGTGKTYSTIDAALEILDPEFLEHHKGERKELKDRFDELVKNQHIRFVTFHQSFSYEDFVEGLSAETENGQIRYDVKSGVFMQLCESAAAKVVKSEKTSSDISNRRVWKMSLGNTLGEDAYIFDECIAKNKILLGYGRLIDFSGVRNAEEVHERFVSSGRDDVARDSFAVNVVTTFVTRMAVGDLVVVSDGNTKFRAIGEITGDYECINRNGEDDHYGQSRSVRWLRVYSPSLPYEQLLNKSFSQMTIYQLKEPTLDREKLTALLSDSSESSEVGENTIPRVLIIDEINRGNISKIFGELITLIEPSKRAGQTEALEVILPYSKKPFSVPSNVYIIGTMNTSDRSLAGLDIALRRRFVFKEMPPKPELLDAVVVEGVNIGELLRVMNQRIEVLLGRDYCLGHAYFMSLTNESSLGDLAVIFQKQIFPLLQEYFFEDWQRIQWVLNDHNKTSFKFIERKEEGLIRELFGAELPIVETQLPWVINRNAFVSVDAYQGIIKVNV